MAVRAGGVLALRARGRTRTTADIRDLAWTALACRRARATRLRTTVHPSEGLAGGRMEGKADRRCQLQRRMGQVQQHLQTQGAAAPVAPEEYECVEFALLLARAL
eukprot:COSAG02_NODE_133_length_34692_cov_83.845229_27_plen_105_part_00